MAFFNKRKPVTICSINHVTKKKECLILKDLSSTCHCAFFWMSKSKSEKEFLMRSLSSK